MNCKEKTTLKLSSNIISKYKGRIGWYIPVELKSKEFRDIRMIDNLSPQQQKQLLKEQFLSKEIREDVERYSEKKENVELCKNCKYKDICF